MKFPTWWENKVDVVLLSSSSGALYNYGVLKGKVRVLGGKRVFPLKFDGLLDEKVRGLVKLLPFYKLFPERTFYFCNI